MDVSKRLLTAAACAAVLAAVPATQASAGNWYVGAGVGASHLNGGATAIDPNLGTAAEPGPVTSLDDKDTGWKVFGGYQFNRNFAAEAIYAEFGKFEVTHAEGAGSATDRVKPKALCLAGVGTLPVSGNWSLLGKVGVCHWNDHPSESETTPDQEIYETSSGTDPMFGLGAGYDLTKNVNLRAEWERYQNVVHNHGDVDLYSVSVNYRF